MNMNPKYLTPDWIKSSSHLLSVQIASHVHPVSYTVGAGIFPQGLKRLASESDKLHNVLRLRMHGALPQFLRTFSWQCA
jgi:hypothetical protein